MHKGVLIYGCGGHGKVVLEILESNNTKVIGFIDDDPKKKGLLINNIRVLGNLKEIQKEISVKKIIVGVSENKSRASIYRMLIENDYKIVNAIHPSAIISERARIGEGAVIMPGVVINTNAEIGTNVILNTNSSVDHDCIIGDNSQVQPGAVITGTVRVEEFVTIGSGAVILPNLTIGKNSIIGAGAVVTKSVDKNSLMIGVPARKVRTIEDSK